MDCGVLPQVKAAQMRTEDGSSAPSRLDLSIRKGSATVCAQRRIDDVEIGQQLVDRQIGV